MVADVPVGVFLSGGYDSTCLVALLQRIFPRSSRLTPLVLKMKTDKPGMQEIASIAGTEHHGIIARKRCTEFIRTCLYYDEPFADNSAIATMLVSKMARQSVTVASADAEMKYSVGMTVMNGCSNTIRDECHSLIGKKERAVSLRSFLSKNGQNSGTTISFKRSIRNWPPYFVTPDHKIYTWV